jgi:hypothetical protein
MARGCIAGCDHIVKEHFQLKRFYPEKWKVNKLVIGDLWKHVIELACHLMDRDLEDYESGDHD